MNSSTGRMDPLSRIRAESTVPLPQTLQDPYEVAPSRIPVNDFDDHVTNSAPKPNEGPFVRFGVTNPVNLKLPTARDRALTLDMETMLREKHLYETDEGQFKRSKVLGRLMALLCDWVKEVYEEINGSKPLTEAPIARVFTFGSYRLGVVTPGGDIDALCVVPNYVTREAFFESFFTKLQQDPEITNVLAVPDAYTPIIKLECLTIDVDLLLARLSLPKVPENLSTLCDDSLLESTDEKTVRSINGCRVAEDLLRLVPNVDNFILTLRFIKHWAMQRGIYSNVLGYLGGVSWALLVARVCQLYPHAAASELVYKFFFMFTIWDWSLPILLCQIKEHPDEPRLMHLQTWNPKTNQHDRYHLMPIVTPSFPSMNSTHNVTLTTRQIIVGEFHRGLECVSLVRKGLSSWSTVVEPFDFFDSAKHFLEFLITGQNHKVFTRWCGWVESKLRLLIKKLESIPMMSVQVWPGGIPVQAEGGSKKKAIYFAVRLDGSYPDDYLSLCSPVVDFVNILINQWPERETLQHLVDLSVSHITQETLPEYAKQYRKDQGFSSELTPFSTCPTSQSLPVKFSSRPSNVIPVPSNPEKVEFAACRAPHSIGARSSTSESSPSTIRTGPYSGRL